ncbi:7934_t:CDS:1, partial [Cetraspora pellucida]
NESELPSEDEILYSYELGQNPQIKNKKNNLKEIIMIFDSDKELPEVDTLLLKISKKRKITSISRTFVKTPACNDDYSFIYDNKTYQLKKYEIEKKIKYFKR